MIHESLARRLNGRVHRLTVTEETVLDDALAYYKNPDFDESCPLRITFENQPAVDTGGARRQFYSMLFSALESSSQYKLFEGPPGRLMPLYCPSLVFSGLMKILGKMIAHSIVQCDVGMPVFSPVLYLYVITGDVSQSLSYANLQDIRDENALFILNKVLMQEGEDLETLNCDNNVIDFLSNVGIVQRITVKSRQEIIQSIMLHYIVNKKKVCLDQFREGLDTLGLLEAAKAFPLEYEKYFVHHDDELTPDKVKSVLTLPKCEGTPVMLLKFLDECSLKDLQQFLRFTTGSGHLPVRGSGLGEIKVLLDGNESIFASTCLQHLHLPIKFDSYEVFKGSLHAVMGNADHSFNAF